jgi:extradiol dioxygenase family protein
MIITGVFHVAIKTADLDATVSFYTQGLGFKHARPIGSCSSTIRMACSSS